MRWVSKGGRELSRNSGVPNGMPLSDPCGEPFVEDGGARFHQRRMLCSGACGLFRRAAYVSMLTRRLNSDLKAGK